MPRPPRPSNRPHSAETQAPPRPPAGNDSPAGDHGTSHSGQPRPRAQSQSHSHSNPTPASRATRRALGVPKLLVDGGAVYQAMQRLGDFRLDYSRLVDVIRQSGPTLEPVERPARGSASPHWCYLTTTGSHNERQASFLETLRLVVGFTVEGFRPSDGFIAQPVEIGIESGSSKYLRLTRLDGPIAFRIGQAVGNPQELHEVVLVSDSFQLAEPLVRAAAIAETPMTLCFWKSLLDTRWLSLLASETGQRAIRFLDLESFDLSLALGNGPRSGERLDDWSGWHARP